MDKPIDRLDVGTLLARLKAPTAEASLRAVAEELLRLHQENLDLAARIAALETTRSVQDGIVPTLTVEMSLPDRLVIEAAFSLAAEKGFHAVEYDSEGLAYRWTGPRRTFHFELFVGRTAELPFRMRFGDIYAEGPVERLACYVDGEPIACLTEQIDDEYEMRGLLPARKEAGGTLLMFVCPLMQSPADRGDSMDTRQLGIAFRWLKIGNDADTAVQQRTAAPLSKRSARSHRKGNK